MVFLKLKRRQEETFGQKAHGPTVYEISELFTKFGDINIVKKTPFSCYVELQDVDWDVVEDAYRSSRAHLLAITSAGKRNAASRASKAKQSQQAQKERSSELMQEELSRKMLDDKSLTVAQ